MADEQKTRPWWQTLPAVLGGIAAVLTAVASLIVAVRPFGIFERDESDSPPSIAKPECVPKRVAEGKSFEALGLVVKVGQVESANRLASLKVTRQGEPGSPAKLRDLAKGRTYPFDLAAPDGATTSYSITITDLEDRKKTKLSDWGYPDMAEIEVCKLD
jgi:hypothetical protein